MQIGAIWMEAPDPNDYPIKMTVDWVKVYEMKDWVRIIPLHFRKNEGSR